MRSWHEKNAEKNRKKELELKNELKGCVIRYHKKWEAIELVQEIKNSYINTGEHSYDNWSKWMNIETELRNL